MKRARIEFNVFFLIIVTLILYSLFGGVLITKLDKQDEKIGEKYDPVIATYERLPALTLTLDHIARTQSRAAAVELNNNAGLTHNTCGTTGQFTNWNTPNTTCTPGNVHLLYYTLLGQHLQPAILHTPFSEVAYEYYADESRIVGIADAPIALSIGRAERGGQTHPHDIGRVNERAGISGWHYLRPSFSINENPGLTDYSHLRELYLATTRECQNLARTNQTSCIEHQKNVLNITAQIAPTENNYYLITMPSTSTLSLPPIRIGVYLSPPIMPAATAAESLATA